MKEQIIELLGKGLTATQVAMAVGCDDSYISQLLADPDTKTAVETKRATNLTHYVEHDSRVDKAEEAALERMENLLPFVTKPSEAARIFSVLNGAKRRAATAGPASSAPARTVTLQLPESSSISFTLSHDKQVIEIEGRSLATMPAKNLAQRLEQRNAARLLETKAPALLLNASGQVIDPEAHRQGSKATFTLAEQL